MPAAPSNDNTIEVSPKSGGSTAKPSKGLQDSHWASRRPPATRAAPPNAPTGPKNPRSLGRFQPGTGGSTANGSPIEREFPSGLTTPHGRRGSQGFDHIGPLKDRFTPAAETGTSDKTDFSKPVSTSGAGKSTYQPAGRSTEYVNTPTTPGPGHQQAPGQPHRPPPLTGVYAYGHPQYAGFTAPTQINPAEQSSLSGATTSNDPGVSSARSLAEALFKADGSDTGEKEKPELIIVRLPGTHTRSRKSAPSGTSKGRLLETSEPTQDGSTEQDTVKEAAVPTSLNSEENVASEQQNLLAPIRRYHCDTACPARLNGNGWCCETSTRTVWKCQRRSRHNHSTSRRRYHQSV